MSNGMTGGAGPRGHGYLEMIMVAVPAGSRRSLVTDPILNDEPSVRRLLGRLADKADGPQYLRCCYEAGPGGYDLYRLLDSMGIACDVVAPSLIPKGSGDRVETDKRELAPVARLHRAGELTPVRVPSRDEKRSGTWHGPAPPCWRTARPRRSG